MGEGTSNNETIRIKREMVELRRKEKGRIGTSCWNLSTDGGAVLRVRRVCMFMVSLGSVVELRSWGGKLKKSGHN